MKYQANKTLIAGQIVTGLTLPHWTAALQELRNPTDREPVHSQWRPKRDFGLLPTSLTAADWTPQDFRQRGFPHNDLPDKPVSIINPDNWDKQVEELLHNGVINTGNLPIIAEVKEWLENGCPNYLQYPGTVATDGHHHIEAEEMQMVTNTKHHQ